MAKLTTAEEAVHFWAPEGARIDHLLKSLEDLLPTVSGGDEAAITPETREDVNEALTQARLAMDTILGAYTRVLAQERNAIQQFQSHAGPVGTTPRNAYPGQPTGWPQQP